MTSQPGPNIWAQKLGGEPGVGLILPLLFAIALAALAAYQNQRFIQLELMGQTGVATIQSKSSGPAFEGDRNGSTKYRMIVSFAVGETIRRGEVSVGRDFFRTHNDGDQVAIRYLPNDPQIREIDPSRQARFVKEWILIIGLLLAIGVYNFFALEGTKKQEGETK